MIILLFVFSALISLTFAAEPTVVLITGCSSGIGKAAALHFAANPKFKVWATMRNTAKWDAAGQENIIVKPLDVTNEESVNRVVNEVINVEGKVDILINNAGVGLSGCLESVTVDQGKKLFDVNVWGVVRVLQAVLPYMRAARSGHVINLSSTSGLRGLPCSEYYTASKFALEGIMDSMRYTMAAFGISITNINPGPVATDFGDKFGVDELGGRGNRVFEDSTQYLEQMHLKSIDRLKSRLVSDDAQRPEEVANVIMNIVILKDRSDLINQVPFNTGTGYASQMILSNSRKHPSGWGGMYNTILDAVPSIDTVTSQLQSEAEREAKAGAASQLHDEKDL